MLDSKIILHDLPSFETFWKQIGSTWLCISHDCILDCLADFLAKYGFDIPDCIMYCVAKSSSYMLTYKQSGGLISVKITKLNKYEQNSQT